MFIPSTFSNFAQMKIYTSLEMKELEAYTMENEPIQSIDLMERAAKAIFDEIIQIKGVTSPVKVFAGSHNNGGDALAVSRLLSQQGYNVEVFLFNPYGHLTPECETNRNRLIQSCPEVVFHEIDKKFDIPNFTSNDLVIDGLFGIGLKEPVTSSFALLIKFINQSPATIVSIDIPSGLMCEDNSLTFSSQIIHANYTLSVQAVKPAFLMADCQKYVGTCKILDIGMESENTPDFNKLYALDTIQNMAPLLKKRDPFGNKGTFGHGLLIAGSYGMAGAAIIAAKSAIKAGLGKLTVHTPLANNTIMQIAVPEAVISHDNDKSIFSTTIRTENFDAVAIGPGIGTAQETSAALMEVISHTNRPLIIDADGLNILSAHKGWLQQIPKDTILTPHPKEFEWLFGPSSNCFEMLNQAREEAIHLQVYIILKGHYSAICTPSGHIFFNTSGNSGLATAGTGDSLTGILLSLLAQGYTAEAACRLGCFIHGLAGDIAADELTEEGLTASDLALKIPSAIKKLKDPQF